MKKMHKNSLMLGIALTFSAGSIAVETTERVNTQDATVLTFEEAISQRQSTFGLIEHDAKDMGKALKAKEVNWDRLELTAKKLHEASTRLDSLFPEGSLEGSKAKDKVWDDNVKFERLLNEMDDGFELLYQATLEKDKSLAQQGLKQAQSTCKACHRQYRSRW